MFRQITQMGYVIDDQKRTINTRNDKTDLDNPGESKLEFGISQFFFDLGIFFQGKLFCFFGSGRFLYHKITIFK